MLPRSLWDRLSWSLTWAKESRRICVLQRWEDWKGDPFGVLSCSVVLLLIHIYPIISSMQCYMQMLSKCFSCRDSWNPERTIEPSGSQKRLWQRKVVGTGKPNMQNLMLTQVKAWRKLGLNPIPSTFCWSFLLKRRTSEQNMFIGRCKFQIEFE